MSASTLLNVHRTLIRKGVIEMKSTEFAGMRSKRALWNFSLPVLALSLLATFTVGTTGAVAAVQVTSTSSTIASGSIDPSSYLISSGFDVHGDKFDFIVDPGATGLRFDSAVIANSESARLQFTGIAQEGTITIQAKSTAFNPVSTQSSDIVTITVPSTRFSQTITFKSPTSMVISQKTQSLSAFASSGLEVELTSQTPNICTVANQKVHAVANGTCSIRASQSGDSMNSPAIDIIKSFTVTDDTKKIINLPSITTAPASPIVATKLGVYEYFPDAPAGSYVDIKVAPHDDEQSEPTQLYLSIPSRATAGPAVFLVSAFSSDVETANGYFVTRISLFDKAGSAISYVAGVYEIKMPAGAPNSDLYWSTNGLMWQVIPESKTKFLSKNDHAVYFHERDGNLSILTDQLGLFGYRQSQAPLNLTSPVSVVNPSAQITLNATGGSGNGSVVFGTTTATICEVSNDGVLRGISEGTCLVTVRKFADEQFVDRLSNKLSIKVGTSNVVKKSSNQTVTDISNCSAINYSWSQTSTSVVATFCPQDLNKVAILYIRSNSSTSKWSDKEVARVKINSNGEAIFQVSSLIGSSKFLHVFVNGEHRL
jgi:hypothetical protein